MTPFADICALAAERKAAMGPGLAEMAELTQAYEGTVTVPLPELDRNEKVAVANLIAQGLDQTAMRIASTMPDVYYPPIVPGQTLAEKRSSVCRKATLGWWDASKMDIKLARRARWLIGYACAPVVIRADTAKGIPRWHLRSPLATLPSRGDDPDEMVPPDCIFTFRRSLAWIRRNYPDSWMALSRGPDATPDTAFEFIEFIDADEIVLGVLGRPKDPYDNSGATGTVTQMELERTPNRAGCPLVVVPGRMTLSRRQGAYNGMIGLYQQQAKLMALEVIAVTQGVFPNEWLVARANEQPTIHTVANGRVGRLGVVAGGDIHTTNQNPGYKTESTIDRLERYARVTGGVPAEFGGECVDEKTEILTADGWQHYDQVGVGDEVLTLNHDTGMSEWQPVAAMNVFPPGPRDMIEMDGPRFSALTTTNHRWPVVRRHWRQGQPPQRVWRTSDQLTCSDQVPVAAMCADLPTEAKWSDALVETVAWFYTEGSVHPSGAQLAQSTKNAENLERIRAALRALFGPPSSGWRHLSGAGQGGVGHDGVPRWTEPRPSANGVVKIGLSRHAADVLLVHAPDKVPAHQFLLSLTAAQLELFIHVSMLADNCGSAQFGQKDQRRTEAFAFACVLAGRGVSFGHRTRTDPRPAFPGVFETFLARSKARRFVKPRENSTRGASTFRHVTYTGLVWCPTTPNGTWFARRGKGTAYFTGNSTTNVRTGRRGDAILSAVVDFPVQEAQKLFAASLAEENRVAVAVAKAYYGNVPKTFYVGRGKNNKVDYVPNRDFISDANLVTYSSAGSDANALVVGLGQRLGVGTISKHTARTLDPLIDDPESEAEWIVAEALETSLLAGITTQVSAGQLGAADVAEIAAAVREDRSSLEEAVLAVQKRRQTAQATSGPPGSPTGPVAPEAPEAQPGLTPQGGGAPPPAGSIGPTPDEKGLAGLLGALKGGNPQPAGVR